MTAARKSASTSSPSRRVVVPIALYIPNLLGYLRIALAFAGLYVAVDAAVVGEEYSHYAESWIKRTKPVFAVLIWFTAAFLDLFDGMLARKLNQSSQFGVLLDVAADNVLRTCIWIAAAVASASCSWPQYVPLKDEQRVLTILAAAFFPCLEWFTMFSTQVFAATGDAEHWKQARQNNDPYLIRWYFANNFRNPLGL